MKKAFAITFLVGLVIYGILNAGFLTSSSSPSEENRVIGLEKGNTAPDFTLTTITGDEITLSELRGKKVILNFWASWCPPCRAEMPDMIEFYEDHKDEVEILAVNMTRYEKAPGDVEEFMNSYQLTFPVPMDTDSNVSDNLYQIMTIPTSYFIDTEGRIQEKVSGAMSYKLMETTLSSMK